MYHHAENTTTSTTTSASSTSEDYPATRTAVVILVSTALFVLAQLYASIPLLAPVSSAFRANATFALSLCFSLAYAVGFLIWGPVSDRYGRKKVVVLSLSVLTLTTLGCAFAPTLGMLAILRTCQGMTAAGFAPVALAYLTESVLPAGRARAIGAMSTAFLAAGIFGQVFASII
ncbi:MAG: MFS transporter, partial [Rothia dentocariosa]